MSPSTAIDKSQSMDGTGMVAVVRGLQDSGLAVTLLDNGKQYTLVPQTETQNGPQRSTATNCTSYNIDGSTLCNSSVQATDGRYASVYKTEHCNVKPTTPPILLTEFPPQRASVCRGQSNFIVGGTGSGDTTYSPNRANGSFRGGLCWSDRESVFSPRPSRQPDAFAKSLRRYPPALTPDRSAEIVERLINYTQAKNFNKNVRHQNSTSTRNNLESLEQIDLDRRMSPKSRTYDTNEVTVKARQRTDESPTRGPRRDFDIEYKRGAFGKNYDIRCLRDVSKNQHHQTIAPVMRERYEVPLQEPRRRDIGIPCSTVSTEIQAAAKMVCREVATTPRIEPLKRHVAVPMSPASSDISENSEGRVSTIQAIKSVQTNQLPDNPKKIRKSVQTTLSSVELVNKCNYHDVRKSKSVEFDINKKELEVEVLEWLDDLIRNPDAKILKNYAFDKLHAKLRKLSKLVDKPKFQIGKFKNVSSFRRGFENDSMKTISESTRTMNYFQNLFPIEVFRAEVIPFKLTETNEFRNVIKDWLNRIPFKSHDFLERPVEREQILTSVVNVLKDISATTPDILKNNLKSEIINMLNEMPIDLKDSNSKRSYLNTLANVLIDKLCNIDGRKYKYGYSNIPNRVQFKYDAHPTEDELKAFLSDEISDFFEKTHLEISAQRLNYIQSDLVDIIVDSMVAGRSEVDEQVTEEIVILLRQSAGLYENQAVYVTNLLLKHLKTVFYTLDQPHANTRHSRMETVMMLQNSTLNDTTLGSSIGVITEEDIEANLNRYIDQLSHEIDEWLTSLRILKTQEQNFRQVVVNDLAGDIVDRHKYLELNPSSKGSDHEELEHLKFQIFKWINKLVGENYTETIERAPELMSRIRAVPVPMLTRPGGGVCSNYRRGNTGQMSMFGPQGPGGSMLENPHQENIQGRFSGPGDFVSGSMYNTVNVSQMPMFGQAGPGGSMMEQPQSIGSGSTSSPETLGIPVSPGSQADRSIRPPKTVQELNDKFDEFVKRWVQEIPIATSTPEEQQLLPTMRTGLYNAVWKAITKLKCQPEVLHNPFYFEDKLDEELDAIFDMVPQTQDFESHKLKVKLIEKCSHINDQLLNAVRSESFKQMLVDRADRALDIYVPRLETSESDEDPVRLYEELEILYLAEDFILLTRYKEEDPVKANVYRNKLLKRVTQLVQEIKRHHDKEMKDINPEMYANDIVAALHQVPLPNDETIKREADQILLGQEIERWYADLPIARNNDLGEQLKRRRLRDALGQKIYKMETSMNFSDSEAERALKNEVSRFLVRMPLGRHESININFMVEELTNRLKNRPRAPGAARRVVFDETIDYNTFKPCQEACSSKIEEAIQTTLLNQSGFSQAQNISQIQPGSFQQNTSNQSSRRYSAHSSSMNAPDPGSQFSPQQLHRFAPNVSQTQSGRYSMDQGRPVSSSINEPDAGSQFSQQQLHSFVPNVSLNQSGGYSMDQGRPISFSMNAPNAVPQLSPEQLHSFVPNVSQTQSGGHSMDQGRHISSSMNAPNAGPQFSPEQLHSFVPNVSQTQSGGYSMDQGRPISSSMNAPNAGPHFSPQQLHSFAPNVSQTQSGGYSMFDQGRPVSSSMNAPDASQFSQQQLRSFAPNVSLTQSGGYSMFDQGRPVSSSLNAPDAGPQFSRQGAHSFAPNVSQTQSGGYSMFDRGRPVSSSLNAPDAGPQVSRQGPQSFVPTVSFTPPGQASMSSYTSGPATSHQTGPGRQTLGYQTFHDGRPVSSSMNPQASGGVEYFSLAGSSREPIRDAHQVSMVQPGQNVSVQAPQASLQSSPANMSEQQWLSLLHSRSHPVDQSMGTVMNASQVGQGIPQVQVGSSQSPEFYGPTDREEMMSFTDQNRTLQPAPVGPSGMAYGQPSVGYLTPQQRAPYAAPPGSRRRQMREMGVPQGDAARRRLDLADEEETEGRRIPCRCIERLRRYRKRVAGRFPCPGYEMEYRQYQQPTRCYYPQYY